MRPRSWSSAFMGTAQPWTSSDARRASESLTIHASEFETLLDNLEGVPSHRGPVAEMSQLQRFPVRMRQMALGLAVSMRVSKYYRSSLGSQGNAMRSRGKWSAIRGGLDSTS